MSTQKSRYASMCMRKYLIKFQGFCNVPKTHILISCYDLQRNRTIKINQIFVILYVNNHIYFRFTDRGSQIQVWREYTYSVYIKLYYIVVQLCIYLLQLYIERANSNIFLWQTGDSGETIYFVSDSKRNISIQRQTGTDRRLLLLPVVF